MASKRMRNNCSEIYSARLRKCPARGCRAEKRFSCEEPEDLRRARLAKEDAMEALLQELSEEAARQPRESLAA